MSWIEVLLRFLREFLPFRVVNDGYGGVRFSRGHASGPYGSGFYWSIPVVWEMIAYPIAEQVVNLTNVSCTTDDGKTLTISANFNYLVHDARMALTAVHNVDHSMATEALKYINKVVRSIDRAYVFTKQPTLEDRIQRQLQKKAETWGITIIDFGLTDVAESRTYRIFSSIGEGAA